MRNRVGLRILCLIAFLGAVTPGFSASFFSFSGNFTQDDEHAVFTFTLGAPGTVALQSWSYAGGVDPLANIVSAGGFGPVLSLFDSGGDLINFDRGGTVGGLPPNDCGTGGRGVDVVSGQCLDAYLQISLGFAGVYTVVLTEQDNTPNGPTLADGFALDGTGNFTGGPFIDAGGFQRNSFYHFTVGPVDSAQPEGIPEPGTAALALGALILGGVTARKRLWSSRVRRKRI